MNRVNRVARKENDIYACSYHVVLVDGNSGRGAGQDLEWRNTGHQHGVFLLGEDEKGHYPLASPAAVALVLVHLFEQVKLM